MLAIILAWAFLPFLNIFSLLFLFIYCICNSTFWMNFFLIFCTSQQITEERSTIITKTKQQLQKLLLGPSKMSALQSIHNTHKKSKLLLLYLPLSSAKNLWYFMIRNTDYCACLRFTLMTNTRLHFPLRVVATTQVEPHPFPSLHIAIVKWKK